MVRRPLVVWLKVHLLVLQVRKRNRRMIARMKVTPKIRLVLIHPVMIKIIAQVVAMIILMTVVVPMKPVVRLVQPIIPTRVQRIVVPRLIVVVHLLIRRMMLVPMLNRQVRRRQVQQQRRHSQQRTPLLATGANNECLVF